MNIFWSPVILPLLEASGAKRIIEIGADSGKNSARLARWCKASGAFADIVDPEPRFDVRAFEERWRGAAKIHLQPSLDVLADLPPADVVLIDGDHNWHTVYHEVRTLIAEGESPRADPPIMVFHDISWPWGRRDAYYAIARIPEASRQPAGIGPISPLRNGWDRHGIDLGLLCATTAGGPRNGVRTAIEDALADQQDRFRVVWFEALWGLCVAAPLARIEHSPALHALLDDLTLPSALKPLVGMLEYGRLSGHIAHHQLSRLQEVFGGENESNAPAGKRPLTTAIPTEAWKGIQRGVSAQTYKGRAFLLSPFDIYNYMRLIETLRPATIVEVGAYEGGRAVWMADMLRNFGVDGKIITIDLVAPRPFDDDRIETVVGNALDLREALPADIIAQLPHPLLVIEDAAHTSEVSVAVLNYFDPHLRPGDYIVVEDGNTGSIMGAPEISPPHRAIQDFMKRRGQDYELDLACCDRFGYNVTANPNGWLRRK